MAPAMKIISLLVFFVTLLATAAANGEWKCSHDDQALYEVTLREVESVCATTQQSFCSLPCFAKAKAWRMFTQQCVRDPHSELGIRSAKDWTDFQLLYRDVCRRDLELNGPLSWINRGAPNCTRVFRGGAFYDARGLASNTGHWANMPKTTTAMIATPAASSGNVSESFQGNVSSVVPSSSPVSSPRVVFNPCGDVAPPPGCDAYNGTAMAYIVDGSGVCRAAARRLPNSEWKSLDMAAEGHGFESVTHDGDTCAAPHELNTRSFRFRVLCDDDPVETASSPTWSLEENVPGCQYTATTYSPAGCADYISFHSECEADVRKLCPKKSPYGTAKCLRANFKKISRRCTRLMAPPGATLEFLPCLSDAISYCPTTASREEAIDCLELNRPTVSKQCVGVLQRIESAMGVLVIGAPGIDDEDEDDMNDPIEDVDHEFPPELGPDPGDPFTGGGDGPPEFGDDPFSDFDRVMAEAGFGPDSVEQDIAERNASMTEIGVWVAAVGGVVSGVAVSAWVIVRLVRRGRGSALTGPGGRGSGYSHLPTDFDEDSVVVGVPVDDASVVEGVCVGVPMRQLNQRQVTIDHATSTVGSVAQTEP